MADKYMNAHFKIYTCDGCGKKFIPTPKWLYKLVSKTDKGGNNFSKSKMYCSYTCWRRAGGDNKKIDTGG